jgi:hypothetical protein
VDIEHARQKFGARARQHGKSGGIQRLDQIRARAATARPRRHLSEAGAKQLEAKLERLRVTGSFKGVRRVTRVTTFTGES